MKISKVEFEYGAVKRLMPSAMDWLERKKLPVKNSRYSRYMQDAEDFFNIDIPDGESLVEALGREDVRGKFTRMRLAQEECLWLVVVYQLFQAEDGPRFNDRLRQVVTGADYLSDAPVSPARNFFYELMVAASFARMGYKIDFEHEADVVARRNGLTVYIECKRVASINGVEDNIKAAGKQLNKRLASATGLSRGLIFIDVSSCLGAGFDEVYSSVTRMRRNGRKEFDRFLKSQSHYINTNARRFQSASAICITSRLSAWSLSEGRLYFVGNAGVVARDNMNDVEFQELNEMVAGYESTFTEFVEGY